MGGLGSGRWKKPGRRTVEFCRALDANDLSSKGCLQPGWSGACQWAYGNEVSSVSLRCEAEQLHLSWHGGEQEEVTEIIPIVRVPCQLGGSRPYFLCSGDGAAGCGRRVIKLYLSRRRFLCRHCSQLVYASPYEQPWQRAFRRANKLWQRLGIAGTAVPEKPKGMPVSTYARLLEAALRAETLATEACTDRLQQLAARIGNRSRKPLFTL